MAEALGEIICKKKPDGDEQGDQGVEDDFGITRDEFRESFYDELLDLINDSDNLVKITSFETIGKLVTKNLEN